jgi:hypothetical protein
MDFPKENMIDQWLEENHNPEIEIQVLNEVVDKLVEERDTLLKQRDEFTIHFTDWLYKLKCSEIDTIDYDMYLKYNTKELLEIYKRENKL